MAYRWITSNTSLYDETELLCTIKSAPSIASQGVVSELMNTRYPIVGNSWNIGILNSVILVALSGMFVVEI